MFLLADADWLQILAAILFFLITGVAQWVQKRSRQKRGLAPEADPDVFAGPMAEPRRGLPPVMEEGRTPDSADWQEQIRRMLEGESPPPSRSLPPVIGGGGASSPPPLPTPAPSPAYASTSQDDEADESFSWEDRPPSGQATRSMEEGDSAFARASRRDETVDAHLKSAAQLSAAAAAFERASHLHDAVAARLRGGANRTKGHASQSAADRHRERAPSADAVVTMLRSPETARQAIVASVVLQSPKGFE